MEKLLSHVNEDRLLLRVDEAAKLMAISRSKAYELIAGEQIPAIRVGKSIRVPVQELMDWIKDNCGGVN
jgi:excisionase family DNA binding protein